MRCLNSLGLVFVVVRLVIIAFIFFPYNKMIHICKIYSKAWSFVNQYNHTSVFLQKLEQLHIYLHYKWPHAKIKKKIDNFKMHIVGRHRFQQNIIPNSEHLCSIRVQRVKMYLQFVLNTKMNFMLMYIHIYCMGIKSSVHITAHIKIRFLLWHFPAVAQAPAFYSGVLYTFSISE